MRALFTADRADEQESAATMRAWMREAGYCVDPHTAVGLAVAEKETRDPSVPMVVLSTAHPAKFPDAVEAACGVAPALPDWLADLPRRTERVTVLPADQAAVERYRRGGVARRARRSRGMSVEVTRLASGLSVVTDRMPHLESASLGVWVGAGSRDEAARRARHFASARTHGVQGHQAAQRAPDRRGDRGGRRRSQCRDQRRNRPPITRACSRPTCRSRSTCLSDILTEPTFDPEELRARAERHRAGDRRQGRRSGRPGVRAAAGNRLSRPAGRPLDPRHAGDGALVRSGAPAHLSRAQLSRARHAGGGRRRRRSRGNRRGGRATFRQLQRSGGAGAGAGAFRRRHARRDARSRAGAYRARARKACRSRDDNLYSLQVFTNVLGGGMSSRLFQEVREKRGLCYTIHAFHMPYSDTGLFGALCRHR